MRNIPRPQKPKTCWSFIWKKTTEPTGTNGRPRWSNGSKRTRIEMKGRNKAATPVPYLDLPAQIRSIRNELDAAIARTLDNCTFCLGPDVAQFEQDFARFCGAEHCVGFNNGTSALHVAMKLLNIGEGDEVITTPFTFVATSWAISYVGAKPVFVDIEDATFNLDPKLVEQAITPRTKVILPVHLYGHPCDLAGLLAISRRHQFHWWKTPPRRTARNSTATRWA